MRVYLLFTVCAACFFGCSPRSASVRETLPDLTGNRVKVGESGVEKKIAELKPEDVIVAVDGVPYTKKMFDDERSLLIEQLKRKTQSPQELMSTLEQMTPLLPSQFVNKYLLILEAQRIDSPSRGEIEKEYAKNLAGLEKARKKTLEQIERSYPSKNKRMMYRKIAEELYIRLYSATNIPPVHVVDSNFVAEVKETIRRSAAEAAATNALIIAELGNLAKTLVGDTEAFAAVANKNDVDPETPKGSGGRLRTVEREQIENKEVAAAIFSLKKVGDITEPIVEEDSAFIIQLISVTPPVTNEQGRVVQGELRETARIYRELEGKPVEMSDAELWRDTDRQMRNQGLFRKLDELMTNGTHKVVYPYGMKLF